MPCRLAPAAAMLALLAAPLGAQLGLITVPRGALRIDIAGAFHPNDEVWHDGSKLPLGASIERADNPVITSLQSSLTTLLGQSVSGLSLGGISATASRDHGVGDIGLAFGLTPRITIFGNVPIVYTRSRVKFAFDPTTSRVGVNPANATLGTTSGQEAAERFFSQFDKALDTLRFRIQHGDYAGPNATVAQQALTSSTTMRAQLFRLLADPAYASSVLPTGNDPFAVQLVDRITALQQTLNGTLALPTFNALPEFPTSTLTAEDFDALLADPKAIGLASPNDLPSYGIGDMSAGVAFELMRRGASGSDAWRAVWLRAAAYFPNAKAADPAILLDQGSGARHKAVQLDGIAEWGTRRMGVRGEVSFRHHLAASQLTRPTSPDQLLVPASFLVAVSTQSGDSLAVTARPWFNIAPHLALSGMIEYWRRGASNTTYLTGQEPVAGVTPADIDIGSAANALVASIGLSYFHNGVSRDGTQSLPIEAGWSIERTISSGSGIFPVSLTSRLYLRIYRPLLKQ